MHIDTIGFNSRKAHLGNGLAHAFARVELASPQNMETAYEQAREDIKELVEDLVMRHAALDYLASLLMYLGMDTDDPRRERAHRRTVRLAQMVRDCLADL